MELLLAANYLDVRSLIELCCAKVATLIKGTFSFIKAKLLSKLDRPSESSMISLLKRKHKSEKKTNGLMNVHDAILFNLIYFIESTSINVYIEISNISEKWML